MARIGKHPYKQDSARETDEWGYIGVGVPTDYGGQLLLDVIVADDISERFIHCIASLM